MPRRTVVTDSTAVLSAEVAAAEGIEVVALPVTIDGVTVDEGAPGATPAEILAALQRRAEVSTSRPAPAALADLYRAHGADGVTGILAVHLSGELSGTVESAHLAARAAGMDVEVVDTRTVGPCLGSAAVAGARALALGAGLDEAAAVVRAHVAASQTFFYVDSLDHLRRGGRIGPAAAMVGAALSVKPILGVEDGAVVVRDKVRTTARALARLEELAADAAAGLDSVDIVVAHLAAEDRAAEVASHLSDALTGRIAGAVRVAEVGAALAVHLGPGMVSVCLTPALAG